MAKQLKCQVCSTKELPVYGNKSDMVKEKEGYIHLLNCHQVYLEEKKQKETDNVHWCALFEYLKVLHNVITIPSRNIKRLHALRDGNDIKDGKAFQRYRRGVSYDLMLEAYIEAEEKIKWFIHSVLNGGNTPQDINGCITMMLDNGLNKAWEKRINKKKREEEVLKLSQVVTTTDMSIDNEVNYRKNKKGDISNLL